MKRRVVVTGMGMVSPLGNDLDTSWKGISEGRSGIAALTNVADSYLERFTTKIAGEVKGFDITADNALFGTYRVSGKDAKKMDPFIHYGLGAAFMALHDSAWRSPTPMPSASARSSAPASAACLASKSRPSISMRARRSRPSTCPRPSSTCCPAS